MHLVGSDRAQHDVGDRVRDRVVLADLQREGADLLVADDRLHAHAGEVEDDVLGEQAEHGVEVAVVGVVAVLVDQVGDGDPVLDVQRHQTPSE